MKANEVKVDIPILPSHGGSLDEIPADVKKRWAEKYEAAYRAAAVNGNADNFIHSIALSEANKLGWQSWSRLTIARPLLFHDGSSCSAKSGATLTFLTT